jgi:hypothetical protein
MQLLFYFDMPAGHMHRFFAHTEDAFLQKLCARNHTRNVFL